MRDRIKAIVTPADAVDQWQKYTECSLTASIDSQEFMKRLPRLLQWIGQHFVKCSIILGDHLNRITLSTFEGLSEAAAVDTAHKTGDQFITKLEPEIAKHGRTAFQIIRGV